MNRVLFYLIVIFVTPNDYIIQKKLLFGNPIETKNILNPPLILRIQ